MIICLWIDKNKVIKINFEIRSLYHQRNILFFLFNNFFFKKFRIYLKTVFKNNFEKKNVKNTFSKYFLKLFLCIKIILKKNIF